MKYLTVICTKLEWDRTKNSINNKINTELLQLTDVYWINDSNDVITACDRNIILKGMNAIIKLHEGDNIDFPRLSRDLRRETFCCYSSSRFFTFGSNFIIKCSQ